MLEIAQLRQSLLQSLENYERCGLRRIPRVSAEILPSAMLAAIEQARTPSTAHPPLAGSAPAFAATTAASPVPPTAVAETRTESEIVAERPWVLPVLSADERQARFEVLNGEVKACRKCADIVCFRQQTVFGTGPLQPTVCFMGEAPGADEDRSGEPFVGRAGQLLTKIIEAMQLKRDEVYILNALKCRPPQNRTPVPEEIEHCQPFVESQLEILQPKYIVCLGAVAVRSLLGLSLPVGSLRGRFHQYRQARVVVTYHPSYLLRNESAKKLVWQDMQMLMQELGLKLPGQNAK
jgi:DNA polymerase